jgi:hypothetical protein
MVAYLTEETLNIIKEHTSIPSDIEIKIIPNKFVLDKEWNRDVMLFAIPTDDKSLKAIFEIGDKNDKK